VALATGQPPHHSEVGVQELDAVIKHKAWLVACGLVQQEGIDYDGVFAPVARMESVKVLGLATQVG